MEATAAALPTQPVTPEAEQAVAIKGNQELVDRISYLASLVSSFDDVDPMMDALRGVTAAWDKSQPMKAQDVQKLQALERDLKNYLITKDPVRAFTAESLEEHFKKRAVGGSWAGGILSPLAVLAASAAAALIPFALPGSWLQQETRIFVAIPVFFVVLQVGISWLYLSALKNFQQEVRKAFQIMCVGIVLFALSFSHYALIAAFSLDSHPLFQYGGFPLLVALPIMFIFYGLRIYAKQLNIPSKLAKVTMSWWFVALVAVLTAGLYIFVPPFKGPDGSDWYGNFSAISGAMLWLFGFLGAILAFKIREVVTKAYARPMTWLAVYLGLTSAASLYSSLSFTSGSVEGELPFYMFMALGGIPMQLLLLWTGYSFKRELSK